MHLDALDVAILRTLTEDARRSLREVANRVGTSPTTVSVRLDHMKEAGLVQGASLVLDPRSMPGRSRLLEGSVDPDAIDPVLEAAADTPGVVEAAVTSDGHLVVVLQVLDLDDEERIVEHLAAVGAKGLRASGVRRAVGPRPAHLFEAEAVIEEACAVCRKKVGADALIETVDERRVVFCCPSCRRDYLQRYERLREEAEKARRG